MSGIELLNRVSGYCPDSTRKFLQKSLTRFCETPWTTVFLNSGNPWSYMMTPAHTGPAATDLCNYQLQCKTSLFCLAVFASVRISTDHLGASYLYRCLILQQEPLVEPVGGKAQLATWDVKMVKHKDWPRNSRSCLEGFFRSFWLSHLERSSCTN